MTDRVPRLWIIDPSRSHPEEEGVRAIAGDWAGDVRVTRPALVAGDGPGPADGYPADGIVIMGSGASVNDHAPWIAALANWIRPLVLGEVRRPLLGICFGHQLVAHVAGGRVEYAYPDRRKRVGVEETWVDGSRLLPDSTALRVVVSHREIVTSCPPRFRAVARRPGCALDGIEHAELPLFSFQFHPEAGPEFAGHVGLAPTALDARQRADSQRLLAAFRRQVKKARAGGQSTGPCGGTAEGEGSLP